MTENALDAVVNEHFPESNKSMTNRRQEPQSVLGKPGGATG